MLVCGCEIVSIQSLYVTLTECFVIVVSDYDSNKITCVCDLVKFSGHSMFLKAINNVLMINGCVLVLSLWLVNTQNIAINTEQTHDM